MLNFSLSKRVLGTNERCSVQLRIWGPAEDNISSDSKLNEDERWSSSLWLPTASLSPPTKGQQQKKNRNGRNQQQTYSVRAEQKQEIMTAESCCHSTYRHFQTKHKEFWNQQHRENLKRHRGLHLLFKTQRLSTKKLNLGKRNFSIFEKKCSLKSRLLLHFSIFWAESWTVDS